jgi:hypothetical protein
LAGQITGYHTLRIFSFGDTQKTVYRTPVADINDLKDTNATATATVDIDMLQHTWMEREYRLDIVRVTNGVHVESL